MIFYLQYETLLRKEEKDTGVYEEAFNLVQDAPFIHSQFAKMRLSHLDKILDWNKRKDGEMGEPDPDKKLNFERNILAFEGYFTDKVASTTRLYCHVF